MVIMNRPGKKLKSMVEINNDYQYGQILYHENDDQFLHPGFDISLSLLDKLIHVILCASYWVVGDVLSVAMDS